MNETPELIEPTPIPPRPSRTRSVLFGAIAGAAALAGTVVGVGAIAGAQDGPSTESAPSAASQTAATTDSDADDPSAADEGDLYEDEAWVAFDECMAEQLGDLWVEPDFDFEDGDFEDGDFEDADFDVPFDAEDEAAWEAADEACQEFLPEDIKAEIAAWAPYEECIDGQIGDVDGVFDDDSEPTEEEWAAIDAAWEAADEACRDLLPEDVQAEMAVWDEFDQCLQDAGVFDGDDEFGPAVHIETGDGFEVVQFGDTAGSVTISGDVSGVVVTTDGGVSVLDEAALDAEWEAIDQAHQACEDLLPEDLQDDMSFDEGDFDEGDLEEDSAS